LGKDLLADGSRIRESIGCSLAISKQRVAVGDVEIEGDASEEFGSRGCSLANSKKRVAVGDIEVEGDASNECGVF
jgi:formylmethanofuran dehydrogenase subunit C